MRTVFSLWTIVFFQWSTFASGENGGDSTSDTTALHELGVIIVTAAKTKKPATVETINRERYTSAGAVTAAEAMALIPGVTVTVGRKNEADVMVRGFSSGRILLMIDGRPVNMPYYGSLDLKTIQLDDISQIQVTKGTPSLLYGVNGSAGVVNIISESSPEADNYSIDVNAELGTVRNRRISTGMGFKKGHTELKGTFSGHISDGYPLSREYTSPLGIENGGIRDNSDFRQYNWTGKARYHFSDNNALAISSGYYTSNKGIPSPTDFAQYRRFEEWKRYFTDLTGGFLLSNNVNIRSKMYYDNFKNEMIEYTKKTLDSIAWESFHDHWNTGSIVTIDIPFYSHTLTAGFNGKYEVASTKGYRGAARETYQMSTGSVVLEGSFQVAKRLSLTAGIGASGAFPSDNDGSLVKKKMAFNGIAGINGDVLTKGKYHCGIGIYNRYPTLHQLFSSERGNPDLRSETALNIDAGVEYTFINCLSAGVTIFDEEFKDLITNYRIEGTAISRYQNIDRACSRGVETNILLEIPEIDCELSFNYVYNATRDFTAEKSLPYVPIHSIGGGINYTVFKGGRINFHASWAGERTGQNEYTFYDDYFILDGSAAYTWKMVTMALTVNNIFDVHYATEEPAYPAPGRMVKGDITISFRREVK